MDMEREECSPTHSLPRHLFSSSATTAPGDSSVDSALPQCSDLPGFAWPKGAWKSPRTSAGAASPSAVRASLLCTRVPPSGLWEGQQGNVFTGIVFWEEKSRG